MDRGSLQPQRPVQQRAVNRPADVGYQQPEGAQQVHVTQKAAQHHAVAASHPHRAANDKKPKGWLKWVALVVLVALIVGVAGWFGWSFSAKNAGTAIDGSKYQAVFFTNGQVYFGKLETLDKEYMRLSDVYYLQTQAGEDAESENPQETTADQGNIQLIKLGEEVHGPEDAMIISKQQLLFYENLKTDGQVAKSIQKFKNP